MKILNKIIEESELFGKELFGSAFGTEDDTEDEKRIYKSVDTFFSDFQMDIKPDSLKNIAKDLNILFKHREEFPQLLKYTGSDSIYRYTSFQAKYDYDFDFIRTLKSINKHETIYLSTINDYGKNANVYSWTNEPVEIKDDFNGYTTILLRSNKLDNTIITPEFSEDIKKQAHGYKLDEHEIIKITNKQAEPVDVVYIDNTKMRISKDFMYGFCYVLHKQTGYQIDHEKLFIYRENHQRFLDVNLLKQELINAGIK